MRNAVTIGDVANLAGVSKGTVSLAYSGKRPVADETKKRVFAAARHLKWQPSVPARALATSKTETIGLVLMRDPNVLATDAFFPRFITGCESVLSNHGYGLALHVVRDAEAEEQAYRRLAAGRADGVILLDVRRNDPRFALTNDLGLATVALGVGELDPFELRGSSYVYSDDARPTRELVRLLIAYGHRRLAYVSGPLEFIHARARRDAFVDEAARSGINAPLVVEGDFTAGGGQRSTELLLRASDRPTAICYSNDVMAIAGMSVAWQQALRIPDDLSVAGFDDSELAGSLSPGLTSVATGDFERGVAVCEAMLAMLEGEEPSIRFVDTTRLTVRGSIGPRGTTTQGVQ
nr:LacI family DNA-binding transcriptional regulator [Actinomyces sp.]